MAETVYESIGEAGFQRLTDAFYRRVPTDDLLGPLYPPEELEGARERLFDFLVFRFGGPQRYLERRGHPALRMRHFPFEITRARRDRWMELMNASLAEADLPPSAVQELSSFFDSAATFLINRPG